MLACRIKVSLRFAAAAWLLCGLTLPATACDHPKGWKPSIATLVGQEAAHASALADSLTEPIPSACNADLRNANLSKLNLTSGDFENVDLGAANLEGATFVAASFDGASLGGVKGNGSVFAMSSMRGADLGGAHLQNAWLQQTDLTGAQLHWTDFTGAILEGTNLTGARYEPRGGPPERISGLIGLETVTFLDATGVSQLRQLARETGQRDLERAATYAIEHQRTLAMGGGKFSDWAHGAYGPMLEGLFRRVAFEWTTGYGLYPGHALFLILLFLIGFAPLYCWAAWRSRPSRGRAGLYRVLPPERIELVEGAPRGDNPVAIERLELAAPSAIAWGIYFSLLSAFNVGFRDFNIGNWISRIQPSRFQLESLGWVRTVSGLQSLMTLYLVAIWLLTYFGRPFD